LRTPDFPSMGTASQFSRGYGCIHRIKSHRVCGMPGPGSVGRYTPENKAKATMLESASSFVHADKDRTISTSARRRTSTPTGFGTIDFHIYGRAECMTVCPQGEVDFNRLALASEVSARRISLPLPVD
jgi:hypothetical protein